MFWLTLVACMNENDGTPSPDPEPTVDSGSTTIPEPTTPTDGDDDDDTTLVDETGSADETGAAEDTATHDTGLAPDPCAPVAQVAVDSLTATPGRMVNQLELVAVTRSDVPVAARCVSDADPTEVHLLEDAGGTTHTFHFSGLLTQTDYTCTAAPICPRSSEPLPTVPAQVRAGPEALAEVTVWVDPALGMTGDYTLFNTKPGGACAAQGGFAQMIDPEGRPRFWHPLTPGDVGVEFMFRGADQFTIGGGNTPEGRPRILDLWLGETYASEQLPDASNTWFHHDGKMLDDGRILTLEMQDTYDGDRLFEGFAVRLHDPITGVLSWEYVAQTGVDAGELPIRNGGWDEWHANWVDVRQENGEDRLYVSLCYYGWVLKIDPVAGHIEWIMGDGGDLSLVDASGAALDPFEFSQCQHGLELNGDRILFYDNGLYRGYSRAAEYAIDESTMTATLLWTWEDDWFETTLGDVDYLDNGRILVNKAHPECWSYGDATEIVEFDPISGNAASRVQFTDIRDASYRAMRIDGCDVMANAKYCPAIAARHDELAKAFAP